jgi:FkbM family methyltransferase
MPQFQTKSGNTLHGPMTWIASDIYIGKSLETYGQFSASETHLFQHFIQPGFTVLDVGANIGVFTVALARMVTPAGSVLAFEPQQGVFDILSSNIESNCLNNITLYQSGVGRKAGSLSVPDQDYDTAGNFGGVELSTDTNTGKPIEITTIDSLGLTACHFIKIDVEGMEAEVLAGATNTITKLRPVLFVENDRKHKSVELIKSLLDLNYRLYLHLAPLFEANNFYKNSSNIFGDSVSANMLCLPNELEQNISGMTEIKHPEDLLTILP